MSHLRDIHPKQLADRLADRLNHPPDLINRTFTLSESVQLHCLFMQTLVDMGKIEDYVFQFLDGAQAGGTGDKPEKLASDLLKKIPLVPSQVATEFDACIQGLLNGQCILLLPHTNEVLLLDASATINRAISEPKTETTVHGPREGLTENIELNLCLLRKRIRDPDFCVELLEVGNVTKTKLHLLYLRHMAPPDVLACFRSRIRSIKTDAILDSTFVEEWIQDKTFSPFPTMLETERPDVAASHILEGRVVVLVDGSPFALVGPITFFQFFTAPEDYYQRADIATLLRWLRMLSFMLAVFVPSIYIAVVSYHQELLPNPLLINIAAQREGVPFPAFLEALLMMVTFEVLREAGLRMPRIAGQAISIVGALVLGEAAVQAGLVTAAMVIVVSTTAISNFVSPAYSFGITQRLLQFVYMALAGFMGLFGVLCGVLFTLVHLTSIRSFGVPYMAPLAPTVLQDWKDIVVRAPRSFMKKPPLMNRKKIK
ncbi:spore germination protein [Paenibacillus hodogayensis]|uniref:Spore germination protein n=1 Tax=Paenibacillus hodogayensis TaxID=279208 RepID=A0ABV5W5Y5_9BACL